MPSVDCNAALFTCREVMLVGGSGFIGTRLAQEMLKRGIDFRIGDISPSSTFPDRWAQCDVRQPETLLSAMRNSDCIVNLAAEHRDDVRPVSRYFEVNVAGAENVCAAARQLDIRKIVFTSSVAVYGFQPRPVDEAGPFEPFNEYGKTKLAAEAVYRAWASEDPSRTLAIIRPTVVFGESNRGNVYNLIRQIASGRFLMVGNGANRKSMAYVGNVVSFVAFTLSLGPGVHIFNYVDGPDMQTGALVQLIRSSLGKSRPLVSIPKPIALAAGSVLDLVAGVSGRSFPISAIRVKKFCESTQFRADRVLQSGFTPPFTLAEGIQRTIQCDFDPASVHEREQPKSLENGL